MSSRLFSKVLDIATPGKYPRTQKWIWQRVYNLLSLFWRDRDWRFMNYGFVPDGKAFPLDAEDEPEREFIGLYQQALDGLPVAGKRVLEVGSGRGGGSRYIARYYAPTLMVGVDYSPQTVRRARRINDDTPAVVFEVGDAEKLPFPDGAFDVVVNIESSHCYGDVKGFANEVSRVLAPGGWFTFADMRSKSQLPALYHQLQAQGLELVEDRNLSMGVIVALNAAESRKRDRIGKAFFMRRFISEFSGSKGSVLYNALSRGEIVYMARRYRKA